jgi:hypothetical protein
VSFDDSSWRSGPAQLGYGDGDEATVVGFGPDSSNKFTTTYFRHTFNLVDLDSVLASSLALMSDDGGIVYLNGEEVFRTNMPSGSIDSRTLASIAIGGVDESEFIRSPVLLASFVEGENVVAVEIHQGSYISSDISFDFTIDVTKQVEIPSPTPVPSVVVSPSPSPTPSSSPTPTPSPTPVPSVVVSPSPSPTPSSSPTPTPSPTPVITVEPSPSPNDEITSAEIYFEENKFSVEPGDTLEIPYRVTVRGRGIVDIITRAVFKVSGITAAFTSFMPVFE